MTQSQLQKGKDFYLLLGETDTKHPQLNIMMMPDYTGLMLRDKNYKRVSECMLMPQKERFETGLYQTFGETAIPMGNKIERAPLDIFLRDCTDIVKYHEAREFVYGILVYKDPDYMPYSPNQELFIQGKGHEKDMFLIHRGTVVVREIDGQKEIFSHHTWKIGNTQERLAKSFLFRDIADKVRIQI